MKRYLIPVMLLLGAAPAFAQGAGANLPPDVQQKIDASRAQFRAQMKPIFEDVRATRQSLRDELQKAQPDDGKLVQLEDRLASDRQQMQALHAQKQAELKRELTPSQYAKLMLSRPRFGRRMHGGGRPGGGDAQ
jgi:Spy/CpxP family protein refolding chaperone